MSKLVLNRVERNLGDSFDRLYFTFAASHSDTSADFVVVQTIQKGSPILGENLERAEKSALTFAASLPSS